MMNRHGVSRRRFLRLAGVTAGAALLPQWAGAAEGKKRRNVLFIAVDDLRTTLGCYGHETIQSPNIDRLARNGLVFERAYCQQAICMSSRASLLSGYRPDEGEIYRNAPLYKLRAGYARPAYHQRTGHGGPRVVRPPNGPRRECKRGRPSRKPKTRKKIKPNAAREIQSRATVNADNEAPSATLNIESLFAGFARGA